MNKNSQTLVEEQLPNQFIYELGLYLQTCAHIEVTVCHIICRLEAHEPGTDGCVQRFHSLRKAPIKDLLKELEVAAKNLPDEIANEVKAQIDWLFKFKGNRHIAAHGAFYETGFEGQLKVLYTHRRKDHGKTVFKTEETVLDRNLVVEAVLDADRSLRYLSNLDLRLASEEILTHPSSAPR